MTPALGAALFQSLTRLMLRDLTSHTAADTFATSLREVAYEAAATDPGLATELLQLASDARVHQQLLDKARQGVPVKLRELA